MFNLTETQQDYLLSQPESGMGYQLVDIVTDAKRKVAAVAYNAELVLALDEPDHRAQFEAFAARGFSVKGYGFNVREIKVLARGSTPGRVLSVHETRGAYGAKPGPAKDAPVVLTEDGEVFKRFTAFENDRRILPDGSVVPGTYATTEEDARHVHTGREAVARYALPNPAPAVNVFTIVPSSATPIQGGIVEPANGQPGGGIEVIFTCGTTAKTASGPTKIPPE
jgi:hypothetical protein